jgi:hypothetical protein
LLRGWGHGEWFSSLAWRLYVASAGGTLKITPGVLVVEFERLTALRTVEVHDFLFLKLRSRQLHSFMERPGKPTNENLGG